MSLPISVYLENLQKQGISLTVFLDVAQKCVTNKIDIIQLMNDALTNQSENKNSFKQSSTLSPTEPPTNKEVKVQTESANNFKNNKDQKSISISSGFTEVIRKKKKSEKTDKKDAYNSSLLGKIEKFNGFYGEFIIQGTGNKLWFGAHHLLCEIDTKQNCIYECQVGENYDKKRDAYRPCATNIVIKKKL